MINPKQFFDAFINAGVDYFTGVPDSLLKNFCAYASENLPKGKHVIAANEGAAVALAMGYHLATNKLPLVYLQNSGLGNLINPILSLVDRDVYSIPMLLLIGWRGEPGTRDEPQHIKQGRVTIQTLEALEIPFTIIDGSECDIGKVIEHVANASVVNQQVHALVVKKGSFENYSSNQQTHTKFGWSREEAIQHVVGHLSDKDIVVATTGMASRELFEYRESTSHSHEQDFLTVGGMGHASQIALGIASSKPDRRVVCIDGDGAVLMHLGSIAIIGQSNLTNFKHIIINNGAHDSVGGQPTVAFDISLTKIAAACGYECTLTCDSANMLEQAMSCLLDSSGCAMLELRVDRGNRKNLGRPTITPIQNKESFMNFVNR